MEARRPPLILDQLPAEIHTGIGSYLTGRELDGVTRASKRLRALFTSSLFYSIKFDGTQPDVKRRLDLFINGRSSEDMSGIWSSVRRASFLFPFPELFDAFSPEEMLPPSLDALRLQILQGVRLVSQVRRLSVDFELFGDGHVQTFCDALPSVPRWEHLRTLKMTGIDNSRELAAALIHSCPSEKLTAVDMRDWSGCASSIRFPPSNMNQFPAMQYIYESRESLSPVKWLAVAEKNPGGTESMDAFDHCLEDMVEALQYMPNLRRFAVTIGVYRFQPREIRDRLGLDGDDNEALTDDEILNWYSIQIQQISDAVPQLCELCMFSGDRIYRGTKSDDGKTMRGFPNAVQPGVECSRFPWGLDDEHP